MLPMKMATTRTCPLSRPRNGSLQNPCTWQASPAGQPEISLAGPHGVRPEKVPGTQVTLEDAALCSAVAADRLHPWKRPMYVQPLGAPQPMPLHCGQQRDIAIFARGWTNGYHRCIPHRRGIMRVSRLPTRGLLSSLAPERCANRKCLPGTINGMAALLCSLMPFDFDGVQSALLGGVGRRADPHVRPAVAVLACAVIARFVSVSVCHRLYLGVPHSRVMVRRRNLDRGICARSLACDDS